MQKPYPIYDQNGRNQLKQAPGVNSDTLFMTKAAEKRYHWGRTYLYSAHKRVFPPRGLDLPSTIIRHGKGAFRKRSPSRWNMKTLALCFCVHGKHFGMERL